MDKLLAHCGTQFNTSMERAMDSNEHEKVLCPISDLRTYVYRPFINIYIYVNIHTYIHTYYRLYNTIRCDLVL
jgi:hypothetical protein